MTTTTKVRGRVRASKATAKTPEQRAAEIAEVTDRLNGAVAELTSSEAWTAMLRTAARFQRVTPSV